MSLYHKYRPTTFNDFVGCGDKAATVAGLLAKQDPPHVYLFTGPPGTGKTSMARVVGVQIDAGEIREYNAAQTRGIDTAREIIEDCMFASAKPILYILDEAHQTSKDFQNAMLKILEDVPANIYFILCSSEPGKLIPAVRSRCTDIKFNPLFAKDIIRHCRKIAKLEKDISLPMEVLESIAEKSNGSMRDALILLESVLENPERALDIIGDSMIDSTVLDLCRALLGSGDWLEVTRIIKQLETVEWESVRRAVLGYMTSVLLGGAKVRAALALEVFGQPIYDSGKAGFVLACFKTIRG